MAEPHGRHGLRTRSGRWALGLFAVALVLLAVAWVALGGPDDAGWAFRVLGVWAFLAVSLAAGGLAAMAYLRRERSLLLLAPALLGLASLAALIFNIVGWIVPGE
jgi:peptidoglycan/LPS O-acetylase OafA/YrhL